MVSGFFSAPGTWGGESFELFILSGDSDELLADTLRAVWSEPRLDGPYLHHDTEPQEQSRVVLEHLPIDKPLYGVLEMPDRVRAGVFTYTIGRRDEGAEWNLPRGVGVAAPEGSLARVFGIDTHPLANAIRQEWQAPVVEGFRALADAVYARVGFRGAAIGWSPTMDEIEQVLSDGVPPFCRSGYLLPDGDTLIWHPSTPGGPPVTPSRFSHGL